MFTSDLASADNVRQYSLCARHSPNTAADFAPVRSLLPLYTNVMQPGNMLEIHDYAWCSEWLSSCPYCHR